MKFSLHPSALVVPPSGGIARRGSGVPESRNSGIPEFRFLRSLAPALGLPLLALFPLLLTAADTDSLPTSAPAVNWVLPLFTDRDGFRSMTLRGATVKPAGPGAIAVTDLNITIFSGDAAARVETVLLSQDATYFAKEARVTGEKHVRVLRDELEVTGENWSYDHNGKKVSIRKDVRVVYRAPLKIPL